MVPASTKMVALLITIEIDFDIRVEVRIHHHFKSTMTLTLKQHMDGTACSAQMKSASSNLVIMLIAKYFLLIIA